AIADAGGDIFNRDFQILQRFLGLGFLANASGQSSGATASTTFTDGNQSATLDQASNGALNDGTNAASISPVDWENGDQGPTKSHYIEGQSVAYRMVLENLTNGAHTLDFERDSRHGWPNAI